MDRKAFIKTTGTGLGVSLIAGIDSGKNEAKGNPSSEAISERDLWVLGHKITLYKETSANFDLAMGETPVNVPGPPPHHHETYDELFLVLEGEMEFMLGGKSIKAKPGDVVDIPKNLVHTFNNSGDTPCKWFNIHSPKGFSAFFETFGIKATDRDALQASIAEKVIRQVLQQAKQFDMIIAK